MLLGPAGLLFDARLASTVSTALRKLLQEQGGGGVLGSGARAGLPGEEGLEVLRECVDKDGVAVCDGVLLQHEQVQPLPSGSRDPRIPAWGPEHGACCGST